MAQFRQGDVFVVSAEIPAEAVEEKLPLVLAEGEATGHKHQIKSRYAKMFAKDGIRYLRAQRPVVLRHQEHDAVTIPVGEYIVLRQVEYSPQAIRTVAD